MIRTEHALSPREREVLALVANGRKPRDIAARLGISPWTARNHIRACRGKYQVDSVVRAVGCALARGELTDAAIDEAGTGDARQVVTPG